MTIQELCFLHSVSDIPASAHDSGAPPWYCIPSLSSVPCHLLTSEIEPQVGVLLVAAFPFDDMVSWIELICSGAATSHSFVC